MRATRATSTSFERQKFLPSVRLLLIFLHPAVFEYAVKLPCCRAVWHQAAGSAVYPAKLFDIDINTYTSHTRMIPLFKKNTQIKAFISLMNETISTTGHI